MTTISDSHRFVVPEPAEHRDRISDSGATGAADPLAESLSLRPSWGRAVTRPGAATTATTPNTTANNTNMLLNEQRPVPSQQAVAQEQQYQPLLAHSETAPTRRATAMTGDPRDEVSEVIGGSGGGGGGPRTSLDATSTPPGNNAPWARTTFSHRLSLDSSDASPSSSSRGAAGGTLASAFTSAPSNIPSAPGLVGRGSSGVAQQLFGPASLLHQYNSVGGQSFTTDGDASGGGGGGGLRVTPGHLPPGSPLGSGRASPAAGGCGSDGGGSAASFHSSSPNNSPLAQMAAASRSPFRAVAAPTGAGAPAALQPAGGSGGGGGLLAPSGSRQETALGSGALAAAAPAGKASALSSGGSSGGQGTAGLGPGQVYLVVDPSTGLVVGTAQATGGSTPGSLAPNTPGAMAFSSPAAGGGHTPANTGSARSSLDLPSAPSLTASGGSGVRPLPSILQPPAHAQALGQASMSGPTLAPAGVSSEVTRAALSLLGASPAAAAAGAVPPPAGSAAAVSRQNALTLASLAAAAAAADSAADRGTGGGGGGADGAGPSQPQPSTADLLMLLTSGGPGAGGGVAPPPAGGGVGGGEAPSAAVALARTLDAATAASILGAGLANGSLTDEVALALAQVAGVLDADANPTGNPAANLQLPLHLAQAGLFTASGPASGAGGGQPVATTVPAATAAVPGGGLVSTPGFTSALLAPPSPAVFSTGGVLAAGQPATAGLPAFASPSLAAMRNDAAGGSLAGLAGLGSPANAAANWRSPSWRAVSALSGMSLGSPGPTAAVVVPGARTTQAAAALAPQGLLAGLASPPGPRGTGPKHNTLYKTEMCRSWQETGSCRYGSKCQFAHGPEELRPVVRHPKYKTEHCRTFAATGACQYGNRCRFIHAAPPGSAMGTPRQQMGPGSPGPHELAPEGSPGMMGGGASLQQQAQDVGAELWARAGEPGGANGALPAAAASLLSPVRAGGSLFSPVGRATTVPFRNELCSPPYKVPRTGTAPVAGSAFGDLSGPPALAPLPTNGAAGAGAGGSDAASRAVRSSLMLLNGGPFGNAAGVGLGGGTGSDPRVTTSTSGGRAGANGGGVDAAMMLFSTFGGVGAEKKAGAGDAAAGEGAAVAASSSSNKRTAEAVRQEAAAGGKVDAVMGDVEVK